MRWLTLLLLGSLSACAAFQGPPKKAAKSTPEVEGEETGVNNIARLLRDFNQTLAAKHFDAATAALMKAERAIDKASDLTRAHPDFEDTTEEVTAARARLNAAIEVDRIERRNAAIDDSISRGSQGIAKGGALLQELTARFPSEEDIQSLREVIAALSQLRSDGRQYEDEERYRRHVAALDPIIKALDERLRQAVWQTHAAEAASSNIEMAYEAAQTVHEAASTRDSVIGFQKTASGFLGCVNALADLEREPDYRPTWLIETRLGILTITDTKRLCTERAGRARQEADWRDWQDRVAAAIAAVGPAMQRARAAKRASDALPAAEAAVVALGQCQAALDGIAKHPGTRQAQTFATPLGSLTVTALRESCAREAAHYVKVQPGLRWASALDDVIMRLGETRAQMAQADAQREPTTLVETWRTVVVGLKKCVEATRTVGADRAADHSLGFATPFGNLTVTALQKECERLSRQAETSLKAATAAAELKTFLATCKGDEIAVAEREGIPSRIETVVGGRLFIYDRPGRGKAAGSINFGFDPNGKRVDFRLRWLDELATIATELNRAEEAIKQAPSGKEALKATEALLPVLTTCAESLGQTEKHPGYDGNATFATALGRLTAARLREACTAERTKRTQTIAPLAWRVRVEELRDRMVEAQAERERANSTADNTVRLQKLAAAVGGFTECSERAAALAGEPSADKRLRVKVGKADMPLAALKKACETELSATRRDTNQARAAKALDDLLTTCHGDEIEVARREGLPSRIERRAGGRLFIYDGKGRSKGKRFAFNADGRRVDEATLKPATPDLEMIPK